MKDHITHLEEKARQLRITIVRALHSSQSGHTGGSLSAIDMITALYFHKMRHNPAEPAWEGRDRFVLSKGHAAPALYAALAEAEGLMIGAEKMDDTAILATASSISERTEEIDDLLH